MVAVENPEPEGKVCLGANVQGRVDLTTGDVYANICSNTGKVKLDIDPKDGLVTGGNFEPVSVFPS